MGGNPGSNQASTSFVVETYSVHAVSTSCRGAGGMQAGGQRCTCGSHSFCPNPPLIGCPIKPKLFSLINWHHHVGSSTTTFAEPAIRLDQNVPSTPHTPSELPCLALPRPSFDLEFAPRLWSTMPGTAPSTRWLRASSSTSHQPKYLSIMFLPISIPHASFYWRHEPLSGMLAGRDGDD